MHVDVLVLICVQKANVHEPHSIEVNTIPEPSVYIASTPGVMLEPLWRPLASSLVALI
jgi:hypothetical protein